MKSFWGSVIKQHRTANNISQAALAERIGVTQKTISRWENDVDPPDLVHQRILRDLVYAPFNDLQAQFVRLAPGYSFMMRADDPFHGIAISRSLADIYDQPQCTWENQNFRHAIDKDLVEAKEYNHQLECAVGIGNAALRRGRMVGPFGEGGIEYAMSWFRVDNVIVKQGTLTLLQDFKPEDAYVNMYTFDDLVTM